jgi:mono/diheme cytochrome c family protein
MIPRTVSPTRCEGTAAPLLDPALTKVRKHGRPIAAWAPFRTSVPSYLHTWGWAAAVVWLTACGPARRSEPVVGPLELDDPVLVRGEQAFSVHCGQCHPRGEAGMGPALNNKPLPTWLIRFQVRNGMGAMPAIGREQLPPDELDALLEYMVALRRHGR